jgi:hypothetical protein
LEDIAQARVGRRITQRQVERLVQTLTMNANEFMRLPIGIGSGDHAEDRVQQYGRQIETPAFSAAVIRDRTQNLQQRRSHPTS